MAMIFLEGFDKYGPVGVAGTELSTLLQQLWNSAGTGCSLVAGLSSTGQAYNDANSSGNNNLLKTLPASYSTFYFGIRFNVGQFGASGGQGVMFLLSGTAACGIGVNTSGQVIVTNGSMGGTVLGTSATSVLINSTHYLEAAITLSTTGTGTATVYLDGVAVLTLTGLTFGRSSMNQINPGKTSTGNITYDDLYLFDSTGSTNNAVLLTSPRVETEQPSSDVQQQFTIGPGVLGLAYSYNLSSVSAPGSNKLALRKFTPPSNCTINSISLLPGATSVGAKFKPVIYSDSAGAPNTLLSAGSEVIGAVSGTALTLALTTPQSLTGGTAYWIGYITDTSVSLFLTDTSLLGFVANNTYASGAPGTAPAMTSGQSSWVIWGNITGMTTSYTQEDLNPAVGILSYNSSNTVAQEDLFGVPGLSTTPSAIYGVQVAGIVAKSDTGARTISLRMKSSASDSGGSNTGQAPGTTFGWLASIFETDPATGVAWTPTGLNASRIGYKLDS